MLRYSMYIMDSPQTQYLVRGHMCAHASATAVNGGFFSSFPFRHNNSTTDTSNNHYSDQLRVLYFFLRIVWYWILACPIVSTIVASYLWLSVGFLGMHWNEGFSSLQHTGYKHFCRMKITKSGDLELYVVGMDKVPKQWGVDPMYLDKQPLTRQDAGYIPIRAARNHALDGAPQDLPSFRLKQPSRWRGVVAGAFGNTKHPKEWNMKLRLVDHCVLKRNK